MERGRTNVWTIGLGVIAIMLAVLGVVRAQPPAAAPPEPSENVQLSFPQAIDIQVLIDYVSQRLGIKILFDDEVADKQISIRAPGEVPADSLLGVLESALKMKGLALVDADAPGWKRIVGSGDLVSVAPAGTAAVAIEKFGNATAVTQTFVLKHVEAQYVDEVIKPFLTDPGSNSIIVAETNTLIVTDYAANLLKIERWVETLDQPRPDVTVETVALENTEAQALATQVTQILTAKSRGEGRAPESLSIQVLPDPRTNQLMLIGLAAEITSTRRIIESLDVPLGLETRTYALQHIPAGRIDALIGELIDPVAKERIYRSSIDEQENILIVTTTPEIHAEIERMVHLRDVAPTRENSPMQFYKIKNLPAVELLNTLRAIEQQSDTGGLGVDVGSLGPEPAGDGRFRAYGSQELTPFAPLQPPGTGTELITPDGQQVPINAPIIVTPPSPTGRGAAAQPQLVPQEAMAEGIGQLPPGSLLGQARITADVHTNMLIIVAEPAVQDLYAELIERLDQRPPQVLIEAKIVIIDTSDDFSLGVEISGGDGTGAKRLLGFSSFGLSTVDPITGALSIIPGLGFNGTLVDPDTADVVLRALATHSRSRVTSAPRVLVNDNSEGQLTSVAEVPFTSLNASTTVATTSFAGFAEAGTTITVTPRISDGDHLQLDFALTLNTFTGSGGDGVPPPRQTDEVRSQITIPDGHTVIVGGLNRTARSWDVEGIPFIDAIPILRYLASVEDRAHSTSSLFIFLRPVILRDDKFRDLKYLSTRDKRCAGECAEFPASEPIWIR